MTNGYKSMIRDRVPRTVNIALKWCKAKEKWINRVFSLSAALYTTKDEKNSAVRKQLGIHEGKQNFNFAESIDLELTKRDRFNRITGEDKYWIWVNGWVNWFCENYAYLENAYNIGSRFDGGKMWEAQFICRYAKALGEDAEKLACYLIKCFNEYK